MTLQARLTVWSEQGASLGRNSVHDFDHAGGIIGRSTTCDWSLPDPTNTLSSRHAEIRHNGHRFLIVDLSTNGVYINTTDATLGRGNSAVLVDGDVLYLGPYVIGVSILRDAPGVRTPPAPPARPEPRPDPFAPEPFAPQPIAPEPLAPWTPPGAATRSSFAGSAQPASLDDPLAALDRADAPAESADPFPELGLNRQGLPQGAGEAFPGAPARPAAPSWPAAPNWPVAPSRPVAPSWPVPAAAPAYLATPPAAPETPPYPPASPTYPPAAAAPPAPFIPPDFDLSTPQRAELPPSVPPARLFPRPPEPVDPPVTPPVLPPAPPASIPTGFVDALSDLLPQLLPPSAPPLSVPPPQAPPLPVPPPAAAPAVPPAPPPRAPEIARGLSTRSRTDGPAAIDPVSLLRQRATARAAALDPPPPVAPAAPVPMPYPREEWPAPASAADEPTAPEDPATALWEVLGIDSAKLSAETRAGILAEVAAIVVEAADGLVAMLEARRLLKTEFHLEQTQLRPVENNPFKFHPNGREALVYALVRRPPGFMSPAAAMRAGFEDMKIHELAAVEATHAAMARLLLRISPATIMFDVDGAEDEGGLFSRRSADKRRLWDHYQAVHERLTDGLDVVTQEILGEELARAYERLSGEARGKDS